MGTPPVRRRLGLELIEPALCAAVAPFGEAAGLTGTKSSFSAEAHWACWKGSSTSQIDCLSAASNSVTRAGASFDLENISGILAATLESIFS